ncbi:MAG TPA: histidine kinase dimerization/phosphoacceptor domain -containing protein [Candidatus Binatia bacterium]|nr:histidine kinase dimerization/phosphoacceptor domain -containing protein [Candidatus Binatia bacterium]
MRFPLQARYTLAIGGLVFVALTVLWIGMTIRNRSFTRELEQATSKTMAATLQRRSEDQAMTIATNLAKRLTTAVARKDLPAIERLLAETRRYPNALSAKVLDPRGIVLHDGTPANADAGSDFGTRWSREALKKKKAVVAVEMEALRASAPIMSDDASVLGIAMVELARVDSIAEVDFERGNLRRIIYGEWQALAITGAITGLALVGLSMMAAAIVAERLATPIGELAERARAIGRGERDIPAASKRRDELGDLARAFDEMAAALKSTTVSKDYVDNILQSMAEMLVVTDEQGRIVTANNAFLAEIEADEASARGASLERFLPGLSTFSQPRPPHFELHRPDGTTVPVQVSVTPLREGAGTDAGHVYVMQNVAERLAASRQIERSLRENEILLKEIHHRVKNNLQIISSMLSLQAARTDDRRARAVFIESESRIRAMALIHEQLYRSGDLARVNIGEYLENLSRQIARYLGRLDCRVEIACDFQEVPVDVAIPCGLIVNELVTNCIQHAFPDGRAGTVSIWFTASKGQRVLIVSDDGVGVSPDVDLESGATLGLKLVRALSDQLGGRLEIINDNGATFRITFPAKDESGGRQSRAA